MSKKNWLKNIFFEDANVPVPAADSQTVKNTVAPTQSPAPESIPQEKLIDTTAIIGTVDKTLLNKLCQVLDEQSLEGIDYLKFKKSVDSLKTIQPEEDIRFTTSFLTLKATNASFSKEYLLHSIDKYIALMEQERRVGMDELKSLRSKNIDVKEKEVEEARKKMENMKIEIQKLIHFISETETIVTAKKNEFAIKEIDFNATIDSMVKQLKNDKTKIETIIK
jgi:hypothetical protein